ncbi:MAG: DUF4339 domain-containing protein [Akkermansiaceae bacterium]|nr:DUF4339 domain-containing protein [Akkermansiaceae bacterium]MCP5545068.1 DUF4339 domain-containing protein [Akkermansiaceae bacterium]MCP5549156.1 DUF4339 domain-containing protein [Akkermansiaceae bacterium]
MSPIHDDLLSEIDSARKLAAEFTNRSTSGGKTSKRTDGGEPATEDDEDLRELAAEEARIAELARERVARKEKARAEAKAMEEEMRALRESIASDKERSRLEAAAVLRELEKAKADERAAAEESIRKAAPAVDPIRSTWLPGLGESQMWYFTSEGERRGPVTFAELRAMAKSSVLDPRLDMIWKKGMDTWKPAGRIDGLFERNAFHNNPQAAAMVAAPEPATVLRSKVLTDALASKDLVWPGVGRPGLWLGLLLLPVVFHRAFLLLSPRIASQWGGGVLDLVQTFAAIAPWLVVALLVVQRFTNLGMKKRRAALLLVPVLNLWIAFRCLFCPPGYAYHGKMDAAGVALMVSCGLAVPLGLFAAWAWPGSVSGDGIQVLLRCAIHETGKLAGSWL